MEDTQLMKGILEGCVLAVICKEETYGYEIMSQLAEYGFDQLIEGTLYPVLTRLQKKGLVNCRMDKSPMGPKRKYFAISDEGREYLRNFIQQYEAITMKANQIFQEIKEDL